MKSWHEISLEDIDHIVTVDKRLLESYTFVSQLESGDVFVPGAPQALTKLLHSKASLPSGRGRVVLTRAGMKDVSRDHLLASIIDLTALAPTNLSIGRIETFSDLGRNTRAGFRFQLIAKGITAQSEVNVRSASETIQLAALAVTPSPILDREAHRSLWVTWRSLARALQNQSRWQALRVCVQMRNGEMETISI